MRARCALTRGARLAAAALFAATTACNREPRAAPPSPTPNPYPATWRFHSEEEWIVAQMVEAIAGIARFEAGKADPAPPLVASVVRAPLTDPLAPRHFTIRLVPSLGASEFGLYIDDHIWSPKAYATVARRLVGPRAASSAPPPRHAQPAYDLAAALLDLRVETLERENRRISAALEADPLDPALNQEAALLLGAFALREVGWSFDDVRVPLSRLAAHLAVARIGGEEATTNAGRLAEIALEALALRQRAAVAHLDSLEPATSGEGGWARALRLAATGDWRQLASPEKASLLERFVYLRTLTERLDANAAQAFADRAARERVSDWRRILVGGFGRTVETCGRYGGWGVLEDEAEVLTVWRLDRGADLEAEDWIDAVGMDASSSDASMEKGRPEKIHVLDLGLWMAFERRRLSEQLRADDDCMVKWFGLEDAARRERKASARNYAGLANYPLIAREHPADAEGYRANMKTISELLRSRPDYFTAREWVDLMQPGPHGPPPPGLATYGLWFDPYSPFGTAYDAKDRAGYYTFRPLRTADFKAIPPAQAEIAPYDYSLRWRLAQSRGGPTSNPTFEATEAVYHDLAEYDAWALAALVASAKKYERKPEYRQYVARRCELIVDSCAELGDWLVQQGEDEEAAKVYRKWVVGARDEVAVSNGIGWLVNYDYDHGRKDEAFKLARRAAAVESAEGRLVLARLLEQTGDLKAAEASYRAVFDHYEGASQYLIGFYRRHANDPAVQPRVRALEREIFPNGLEPLTALASAPTDGVLIAGTSPAVQEAGLRQGSVIVGLDGHRVRDLRQYNWIRFLAPDGTPMSLRVWDGSHMVDVTANPKERWFSADFRNYKPDS